MSADSIAGLWPACPRTPPRVVSQRRDSVAPPSVGPSLAPPLAHRVGGQRDERAADRLDLPARCGSHPRRSAVRRVGGQMVGTPLRAAMAEADATHVHAL